MSLTAWKLHLGDELQLINPTMHVVVVAQDLENCAQSKSSPFPVGSQWNMTVNPGT
jgi:hypothetical protein